uniref:long-chain-fatty-acid--CoA ligase n=1 Tax=Acrobeloides nanus TaxID=290746 RepID=A0A914D5H8_9BILA
AKIAKSGFLSRAIFKTAYNRKLAEIRQGIVRNDSVWDKLIFNKIQEQFGGHIRFTITGSAPISPQILEFIRVTLGGYVMEGYGQTENSAMATATWPGDYVGGNCGGPAVCTLLKLEDVPDMDYSVGEYVAPLKIENIYTNSSYVQQIYVDGDSLERFLIAVVVPEPAPLEKWYKTKFGKEAGLEKICEQPEAKELILKDIQKLGKENKLNNMEQVQAIYLEPNPFTIDNGLLTPTLKSKRPQLHQKYKAIMSEIYKTVQ